MDKHACQVHQRQNKMTNSNRKDYSQCRPEYQLINRRYEKAGFIILNWQFSLTRILLKPKKEPSVCRQCFAACDLGYLWDWPYPNDYIDILFSGGVNDGMCFGGMSSNTHTTDNDKRADAAWIEYPSAMGWI